MDGRLVASSNTNKKWSKNDVFSFQYMSIHAFSGSSPVAGLGESGRPELPILFPFPL